MDIAYWSLRSSSRMGGDGVRWVYWGIYLLECMIIFCKIQAVINPFLKNADCQDDKEPCLIYVFFLRMLLNLLVVFWS